MATKVTPKEFPIYNDNGEVKAWVKRGEYAKATSANYSIEFKAEIGKSHVEGMLDAIEAGKESLTEEAPAEFVKTFEIVKKQYARAVEHVKEEEEKKAAAELEAKELEEKKKNDEEKQFLAVKDQSADFATLASSFDTGENMDRFVPKEGTTDEELFKALNASLKMGEFTSWMKGDLVVELEDRGQINVVTRLAEEQGIAFSTLYRMSKTCRNVPPEKRVKGVSFQIYSEIANAKLDDDKAKNEQKRVALLDKAGAGELNTQTAREAVRAAQGKTADPEKLPEEDDKREFLVFVPGAEGGFEVQTTKGFPKELLVEGVIVVDKRTNKRFAENGFKKDAAKRWIDLPAYTKPEEPKKEEKKEEAPPAAKAEKKTPAKKGKK